ncbi:MAG: hypothetical protein PHP44_04475 [Kiritimatiellae bacterium]|nr:hypothetical protein [Kiritimatiellia bacterium]
MKHRHLTDDAYTLAAIDDVIERGGRYDWAALRDCARADQGVLKNSPRVEQLLQAMTWSYPSALLGPSGPRKDNELFIFKMLSKRGSALELFLTKAPRHGEKQ